MTKNTAKKVGKKPLMTATRKKAVAKTKSAKAAKAQISIKKSSKPPATASGSMPQVGKPAPSFSAIADNGSKISLQDLKGKYIVLYFYPKDDTPGCTVQACGFRDDYHLLQGLDAEVIGVSPDSVASHTKFKTKFNLPFPLLVDDTQSICKRYGVWVEKNMYGKKYMGVQRATFLIDREGKIAHIWPKVKVEEHANDVAAVIKGLDK